MTLEYLTLYVAMKHDYRTDTNEILYRGLFRDRAVKALREDYLKESKRLADMKCVEFKEEGSVKCAFLMNKYNKDQKIIDWKLYTQI